MDIKVIDNFADIGTQLKIIKNLQNEIYMVMIIQALVPG